MPIKLVEYKSNGDNDPKILSEETLGLGRRTINYGGTKFALEVFPDDSLIVDLTDYKKGEGKADLLLGDSLSLEDLVEGGVTTVTFGTKPDNSEKLVVDINRRAERYLVIERRIA